MELKICKYDLIVLYTSIAMLFATIFNPYHIYPGFDLFHNLVVASILTFGLVIGFLFYNKKLRIPYSSFTWVLLLIIIAIQPYINNIFYPDALIFPIGTLLLTLGVSIASAGITNKEWFLERYLYALIMFMLVTVGFQFVQLLGYDFKLGEVTFIAKSNGRLYANFLQPNQASFMLALAGLASLYYYHKNKKIIWLLVFAVFTIGIAFTVSRGGLILGLASIIFFNIFIDNNYKIKLKNITVQLVVFISTYYFGTLLHQIISHLVSQAGAANSLIDRFQEGSMFMRMSLQEQAWLIFQRNPFTGYGWGNYALGSIEQSTDLGWFSFSAHSHFFLSQIASELGILGILCLVPLTIFLLKRISFKMTPYNAVCFSAICIIILYSCSEYPLWYLRFLAIFAIFVTLIDTQHINLNQRAAKYLSMLSAIGLIIIFISVNSYIKIYNIIGKLQTENLNDEKIANLYSEIPNTFGLTIFKEHILFYYITLDNNQIDEKLKLAKRTVATEVNKTNLFRYAKLLSINNQTEESLSMFKAACALDWQGDCDKVEKEFDKLADEQPEIYYKVHQKFKYWILNFDPVKNR